MELHHLKSALTDLGNEQHAEGRRCAIAWLEATTPEDAGERAREVKKICQEFSRRSDDDWEEFMSGDEPESLIPRILSGGYIRSFGEVVDFWHLVAGFDAEEISAIVTHHFVRGFIEGVTEVNASI